MDAKEHFLTDKRCLVAVSRSHFDLSVSLVTIKCEEYCRVSQRVDKLMYILGMGYASCLDSLLRRRWYTEMRKMPFCLDASNVM